MGSIGADLAQRRWGMQRTERLLHRAGCLFALLGVYVTFFSSTLLTSLTYVLVVGLLSVPVIGRRFETEDVAELARPVRTGLSTIRQTTISHVRLYQRPIPGRAGNRRRRL